jgi:hypothetical protein
MARKKQEKPWKLEDDLPIVSELKDCRQLSDDHWQGVDVDGTILDVRGGRMPEYLIAQLWHLPFRKRSWGDASYGLIRVTRARADEVGGSSLA